MSQTNYVNSVSRSKIWSTKRPTVHTKRYFKTPNVRLSPYLKLFFYYYYISFFKEVVWMLKNSWILKLNSFVFFITCLSYWLVSTFYIYFLPSHHMYFFYFLMNALTLSYYWKLSKNLDIKYQIFYFKVS